MAAGGKQQAESSHLEIQEQKEEGGGKGGQTEEKREGEVER